MNPRRFQNLLLSLFAVTLLSGCAAVVRPGTAPETVLKHGTHAVSFRVPKGWELEPQLHPNGRSMKLKGKWQRPTFYLSFSDIPLKREWANHLDEGQDAFSEEYMLDQRRRGYTNVGLSADGYHTIPDGREIATFVEASNGIHLLAFVPSNGIMVNVRLHGDLEDIRRYRRDFYKLLDSCRFDLQEQ